MGLFFDDKPGKSKVSKNMDLDDDLSFDYDGLDDGLDMFDEGSKRAPIERFKSGIKQGAKTALSNPSTYKKLVLDALPNEYNIVNREVDKRYKDLTRIYKDTTGALKEELSSLSEQVEKLVPEDQGVARKLYDATLGKFKTTKRDSEEDTRDYNQEQIDNTLKEVFKRQAKSDKRKEAIDSIRTGLSYKGTLDSIELLTSIDSNTAALRSYQDSVTQAYQKKSLELQYRSYFVQAELLKKFSEYSHEDLAIGKSVIKNTALPDFVKATDSEKIGDVFMTKFGDKVYNKLFNNDFVGNLTKTLGDKAKEMVEQIQAGIFAASSAAEMIDDPARMGGELAGGAGISIVQDIASRATKSVIKKMPKTHEFISGTGKKLHNALVTNPEGYVQDIIDNRLGFNPEDGTVKGFLKEFFSDVLSGTISGNSNILEDSKDIKDLNKPSVYSNKAHLSITEIIPGYLGKMLRELTILRTGDIKTPTTLYDYTSNKFTDSDELSTKYSKIVREQLGSSHRGSLDALTESIAPNSKDKVKTEISGFLSSVSQDRMSYTPENVKNSEQYSKLSKDAQKAVDNYFNSIKDIKTKEGDFERRMGGLRSSLRDPSSTFEEAMRSGHGDVLEKLGLIQKNEEGLYEYDIQNFIKETISDGQMGKRKKQSVFSKLGTRLSSMMGNGFNRVKDEIAALKPEPKIEVEEPVDREASIKKVKDRIKDIKQNINRGNQKIGTVKIDKDSIYDIVDPLTSVYREIHSKPISVTFDGKDVDTPINKGFTTVVDRLDTIIEKISDIDLGSLGANLYHDLKGLNYGNMYQGAKDKFNSAYRNIKDIDYTKVAQLYKLLKAYKLPQPVIDHFITAYTEGKLSFDEIVKELGGSFNDFKDMAGETYEKAKTKLTDITIGDVFNSIGSGIQSDAKGLWGFATTRSETFGKITDTVMKAGGSIFDFVVDKAKEAKDPVYNGLKSILGTMLEFSKNALEVGKDFLFNKLPIGIKAGYEKISSLAKAANRFYLSTDVYVKGETEPRLTSRLLRNGYYILRDSGEPIYSFKDIKGTIVDPDGNVILSTEDINLGLVDKDGNELSTPFEKLLGAAGSFVKSGFKRLGKFFNNFEFSIPNLFSIFNYHNDKIVNVLVEIRNILLSRFGMSNDDYDDYSGDSPIPDDPDSPDGSGSNSLKDRLLNSLKNSKTGNKTNEVNNLLKKTATNAFDRAKISFSSMKGISGIGNKLKAGLKGFFKRKDPDPETDDNIEDVKDLNETNDSLKDRLLDALGNVKDTATTVVDRTKNSFKDRLARVDEENKDKHKFVETEAKARYNEGNGILGTIKNMFSYITNFFSVSGFAGFLGGVLTKIPIVGPLLSKLGSMFGLGEVEDFVGPNKPSVKPKGVLGTLRNLGGKTIGALSSVAGFGAKTLARGALALGGMSLSGVAAAATTALTGTISAMGTIGAAMLSPVGLAVIGTGLAVYGAYKAYKYLTDGKLNDYEKVRYLQYGIDPENETHTAKISIIGSIEEYLMDEGIQITKDNVSLAPNVDAKKILEIAGIEVTNDNEEIYTRFTNWFNERFKPVFLKHCLAINRAKQGIKLKDIDDLNDTEKSIYLSLVTDGISNVYSYLESPYQDMDPLVNKHVMIDLLVKRLLLDLKKSGASTSQGNIDKLKKEIATKETQQKLANQAQTAATAQKRAFETPVPTQPTTPDTSIVRSSVASKSSIYAVASNDNTTIPAGDGSSNETSVKLDGLGNVPISKELRVAAGPLRDGSMASKYITVAKSSVTLDGMDPTMLKMLTGMIEEYGDLTGKKVIITDGFRTYQEQARLYAKNPAKAAPPGGSLHEFGLAVDIDRRNLNEMDSLGLMRKYGFTRPVGGEPWHIEPAGIQGDIARAKQDINFRNQAISSSLGKGGGGYGTMTSSRMGKRNNEVAKALFTASASNVDASSIMDGSKDTSKPPSVESTPTPVATFNKDSNNQWSVSTPTDSKVTDGSISSTPNVSMDEHNSLDESISKDLSSVKADPSIVSTIDSASQKIGVDTTKMLTLAAVESDFKPNAKAGTSSAKGLYQFINSTYKSVAPKVGLPPNSNPNDPSNSALVGAKYTKDNENTLGRMGVGTGTFESYIAHFLGPGGAKTLLKANDNEIAAKILPSAARSNTSIFYDNGRARTVQGVKEEIRRRLVSKAKSYNIPLDRSLSSSGNVGMSTNISTDIVPDSTTTDIGNVSTSISESTPIYNQEPVRPSFKADNSITPAAVSTKKAEVDTTSENYSKVIASNMDISISLQEGMLSKLTSIDATLMKALTDVIAATGNKNNSTNRYREELKPSIDLTRTKAT